MGRKWEVGLSKACAHHQGFTLALIPDYAYCNRCHRYFQWMRWWDDGREAGYWKLVPDMVKVLNARAEALQRSLFEQATNNEKSTA
jgi:hypothetical protein